MQDVPIPHRCEGNVKIANLSWLAASNRHTLVDLTFFDGKTIVRVDLDDLVGSNPRWLELVGRREMVIDVNHLANLVVKMRASSVFALETKIRL